MPTENAPQQCETPGAARARSPPRFMLPTDLESAFLGRLGALRRHSAESLPLLDERAASAGLFGFRPWLRGARATSKVLVALPFRQLAIVMGRRTSRRRNGRVRRFPNRARVRDARKRAAPKFRRGSSLALDGRAVNTFAESVVARDLHFHDRRTRHGGSA